MNKVLMALWSYLSNWKNLLVHTLVGVSILAVAFFLPVHPAFRVVFLIFVIAFNIIRMKLEKKVPIEVEVKSKDGDE